MQNVHGKLVQLQNVHEKFVQKIIWQIFFCKTMFSADISWLLSIVGRYHCYGWDGNQKPISLVIRKISILIKSVNLKYMGIFLAPIVHADLLTLYTKHRANDHLVIWRCTCRTCRGRVAATAAGLLIEIRSINDHEVSQARVELGKVLKGWNNWHNVRPLRVRAKYIVFCCTYHHLLNIHRSSKQIRLLDSESYLPTSVNWLLGKGGY